MTSVEILDAVNGYVEELGRINQSFAITSINNCLRELATAGLIISSLAVSVTANDQDYDISTATGLTKIIEMRDDSDDDQELYDYPFRVRTVSGVQTLIFDEDPPETETITIWYTKRHTEITASNFSSQEIELDEDFHDLLQCYLKADWFEYMDEDDKATRERGKFEYRKNVLRRERRQRFFSGQVTRVREVWS